MCLLVVYDTQTAQQMILAIIFFLLPGVLAIFRAILVDLPQSNRKEKTFLKV